jgi:hypothetical protein
MARNIPIHPKDKTFVKLMKQVVFAIRTDDTDLIKKVKDEFAESSIHLYYNQEKDIIRVLKTGSSPIDFQATGFEPTSK